MCKYPDWAINRTKLKISTPKSNNNISSKTISRDQITVSYSEGLSESEKNICKKYGIQIGIRLVNDILWAMENQNVTALYFINTAWVT